MKVVIVNFKGNVAVCKSKDGMYCTTVERNILKKFNVGDEVDLEKISEKNKEERVFGEDYVVFDDVMVEIKR